MVDDVNHRMKAGVFLVDFENSTDLVNVLNFVFLYTLSFIVSVVETCICSLVTWTCVYLLELHKRDIILSNVHITSI